MTERGKVQSGSIVFDQPLGLPEGTQVIVCIEPVEREPAGLAKGDDFTNLPFFGMWADRDDMTDSVAWVRRERDKWQQRLTSRD